MGYSKFPFFSAKPGSSWILISVGRSGWIKLRPVKLHPVFLLSCRQSVVLSYLDQDWEVQPQILWRKQFVYPPGSTNISMGKFRISPVKNTHPKKMVVDFDRPAMFVYSGKSTTSCQSTLTLSKANERHMQQKSDSPRCLIF